MDLFIRNVDQSTSADDLKAFVKQYTRWTDALTGQKPKVLKSEILTIVNRISGDIEFHGKIKITPDKAAESMIRRLNRKILRGRIVEVRQWYSRSSKVDPNKLNMSLEDLEEDDDDRRRNNIKIIHSRNKRAKGKEFFSERQKYD